MNKLLQKHLKRKLKDLYQEINQYLTKLSKYETEVETLKKEIISYEVAIESYEILFPNWQEFKETDKGLYNEILGFYRLIEINQNQIGILKNNIIGLEKSVKELKSMIVSTNIDISWSKGDSEDYEAY